MTEIESRHSRRSFFVRSGAVLGAGVGAVVATGASAAVSATPASEELKQLRQQLDDGADREAIRQLHLAFTTLIELQTYEAAADLFDESARLDLSGVSATGKAAIVQLFVDRYRHQNGAALHSAYRRNALQQRDALTLSEDRLQATATFHVEVELCTPLQADCTVAQMARLQGHVADRRWEAGRFEATYVKTRGEWKIASLGYMAS
jgi:hypothetical protein